MSRLLRLICLACLPWLLAACSPAEPPAQKLPFKGSDLTGVAFGGDFALLADDGQRVALSDYRGKVVALFFGYTHCPDVCPTTMLEYAAARRALGEDGRGLQVLFVSLDPARDTPAVLKGYVPHFDPTFVGLTGTADEVAAVAGRFKIVANRVEGEGGGYTLDHSAGSYLIGRDGQLRVYQAYGTPADALAHDIRILLR
ncbi:SCO family protein [Crenobacter intestini]|uniref:SCO family protein n=1 Tax=Crenobacter intestini TaxID=2563443 RepID=A0A4T0UQU7_9NEIS|nr:SCO family protein [Crenobacter intestini]TIC81238.1 SCO family protein [Crenobacter intestini]